MPADTEVKHRTIIPAIPLLTVDEYLDKIGRLRFSPNAMTREIPAKMRMVLGAGFTSFSARQWSDITDCDIKRADYDCRFLYEKGWQIVRTGATAMCTRRGLLQAKKKHWNREVKVLSLLTCRLLRQKRIRWRAKARLPGLAFSQNLSGWKTADPSYIGGQRPQCERCLRRVSCAFPGLTG